MAEESGELMVSRRCICLPLPSLHSAETVVLCKVAHVLLYKSIGSPTLKMLRFAGSFGGAGDIKES